MPTFTYRTARSGAFLGAIVMVLLVETVALHAWLVARHPVAAWTLTALSLLTILWLAADYRAMGRAGVAVTDDAVDLRVGRRFAVRVPRDAVARAVRPGWRDLPAPGTMAARDYLNLTKPASPNVLLTLRDPVPVRLPGGLRRSVLRLGLHLDDPDAFLGLVAPPAAAEAGQPR